MNNVMPECLRTSNDAYPYCFGAKHPHQFAENNCCACPWYSEYWHERKIKEIAEIKEFNIVECEFEVIKD